MATNGLDFASSPVADKEVDSVLSSDAATNQYIPHEPDLESLLRSVNAHEDTHGVDKPMPPQNSLEVKSISAPGRIDTGTALREAQGYQSQRPKAEEGVAIESSHRHDAGDKPLSDDQGSCSQASGSRPDTRHEIPFKESTTPTSLAKATNPPRAPRFRIGYGKLLIISLVSQLGIEIFLTLCANEIVGWYGWVVACAFVTVGFFFTLLSIVFTIVSDVKKPKSAPIKGFLFPLFRADY
ncbi:MAG: hypothetical protein Q9191_005349 [Dirinaria sp. TL-2023a]